MRAVIVLLSIIVAFIFGGSILAGAALLIGLAIIFPNTFGAIAAVIGAMIALSVISVKFGIDVNVLLLWIVIIFFILIAISFIVVRDESDNKTRMHERMYEGINENKLKYDLNELDTGDKKNTNIKEKNIPILNDELKLESSTITSVADELLKLKKLKDDGVITDEEFDTEKNKLLK